MTGRLRENVWGQTHSREGRLPTGGSQERSMLANEQKKKSSHKSYTSPILDMRAKEATANKTPL